MKHSQSTTSLLLFFLSIVTLLTLTGIIFTYSASSAFAVEQYGSPFYFLLRHFFGISLGLIGALACYCIPLNVIERFSPLLFLISLFMTAATCIPGLARTIHGSSRWINIAGFSFQPSDLLKIMIILYAARLLKKKSSQPFTFQHTLAPFLIIIALTGAFLLKQPDFGLTVTLTSTLLLMLLIAGLPLRYAGYLGGTLIPALTLLIVSFPYRLRRILIFLNPWKDPRGSGFQIIQSLIAIGSGGLWGLGIGHSKQKFFYIPMQHTDFIFSIIAEETGFIGTSLLICLYGLFLYCGCKLALKIEDLFGRFMIIGFTLLISLQALINIFVATGLFPTKGIGLPFVSYGNSALVCSLCMIGLIANAHSSLQK